MTRTMTTTETDQQSAQRYADYRDRLFASLDLGETERMLAEHWAIALNAYVIARAIHGREGRIVRHERFVEVQKAALALALQQQEVATPE